MVLRIHKISDNRIFKVYLLAMFVLMVARYIFKVDIPAAVFLLVTMLPIWWGTPSEQLACAMSFVPISVAFQYKYALLFLSLAILAKNRWRLKMSGVFIIVLAMMAWELWHAFYGSFSYEEYLRDFAELLLLGVVTSIGMHEVDHKLVIRSLSVSVVGVCVIMLIMQLQQFGFDLVAVFIRSAQSFRFGQDNMETGRFAINFNANNLGFICNLATSGGLLLSIRKEQRWTDIALMACSVVFALMTLSRSAVICMVMLFVGYMFMTQGNLVKKLAGGFGTLAIALLALVLINLFVPSVFENLLERFQRDDVLNGRSGLFNGYNEFLFLSPTNWLFGIGMQQIYEKVVQHVWIDGVPHMGLQEVLLAWGVVGLILFGIMLWRIITVSRKQAGGKRQLYQYMPLMLTMLFTMSGQLLTSSRALMALTFSYICLCVAKVSPNEEKNMETV